MQFLNPLMLWGALAVTIPIALHFWHQKKGQLLNWAATQWLTEKDLQPSKGIRLDNILLLIIRCLLVLIIAFLLAKPIIHWATNNTNYQKIHLVQPHSLVVDNYKFELEEALKKGEKIYEIGADVKPLESISAIPVGAELQALEIQTCINKVYENNHQTGKLQFELYLTNNQSLSQVSNIFVPSKFTLHSIIDTIQKQLKSYVEFSNQQKLFVNAANRLTVAPTLPINEKFENQPIHKGSINVLIATEEKDEKQTIQAALKAMTDVYSIEFSIDEKLNAQKQYDWVFTNREITSNDTVFSAKTLFLFSDESKVPLLWKAEGKAVSFSSEKVSDGQLPEGLGEVLVKQYQLNPSQKPLSNQQLNALFKTSQTGKQGSTNATEEAWTSKLLLLIFIIILGIERWLAIRKNA